MGYVKYELYENDDNFYVSNDDTPITKGYFNGNLTIYLIHISNHLYINSKTARC